MAACVDQSEDKVQIIIALMAERPELLDLGLAGHNFVHPTFALTI
jgi:hypothetical protein